MWHASALIYLRLSARGRWEMKIGAIRKSTAIVRPNKSNIPFSRRIRQCIVVACALLVWCCIVSLLAAYEDQWEKRCPYNGTRNCFLYWIEIRRQRTANRNWEKAVSQSELPFLLLQVRDAAGTAAAIAENHGKRKRGAELRRLEKELGAKGIPVRAGLMRTS